MRFCPSGSFKNPFHFLWRGEVFEEVLIALPHPCIPGFKTIPLAPVPSASLRTVSYEGGLVSVPGID
jgi:hypothetical protein